MYVSVVGLLDYLRQLDEFRRSVVREDALVDWSRGSVLLLPKGRERVFGLLCVRCSWQAESFDRQACRECGSELERRLLDSGRVGR